MGHMSMTHAQPAQNPHPNALGMGTAHGFCGYRVFIVIHTVFFFYLLHSIYRVFKACTVAITATTAYVITFTAICTLTFSTAHPILTGMHDVVDGINHVHLRGACEALTALMAHVWGVHAKASTALIACIWKAHMRGPFASEALRVSMMGNQGCWQHMFEGACYEGVESINSVHLRGTL